MRHVSDAPALELVDVWRVHGSGASAVSALAGLSLEVWPGELVAVMGPSGSGKSTLLNLAGGLDQPTEGEVRVMGESTGQRPAALARLRRRYLGFVFQDLNLVESLTAAENVALPRELEGVPVRVARREAVEALALVGLAGREDRVPARLSGGEQQRVAIARSLIGGRRLLLADEPTGALDTGSGDEVLGVIRDRCDAGAAALVVTHNGRHAAWADRVLFLRDGREVTRSEFSAAPIGAHASRRREIPDVYGSALRAGDPIHNDPEPGPAGLGPGTAEVDRPLAGLGVVEDLP